MPVRSLLVVGLVAALVLPLAPATASAEPAGAPAGAPAWVRHGFAEGWALAAEDLDGDGTTELLYGGRGIAALDEQAIATHRPRWTVKWNADPANVLSGGDNQWVTGLQLDDATGDGIPDAYVTTSDTDAYLVDGRTGAKVWHNPERGGGLSFGFAFLDADQDGVSDFFPTGTRSAFSGRTGEKLWTAAIPRSVRHAVTAELDGTPGREVVVAIYPPGASTDPTKNVEPLTAETVFALDGDGSLLFAHRALSTVRSVAAADVDGDGVDEAVVGTHNGIVYAVGRTGLRWTSASGIGAVTTLAAHDVDGDGRDEIFAGTGAGLNAAAEQYEVMGLTPLGGGVLWRQPVAEPVGRLELADTDRTGAPELLVGTGTTVSLAGNAGEALALETPTVATERVRWRVDTVHEAKSFAALDWQGRRVVAIGAGDGLLRVVDGRTGAPAWQYAAGGYIRPIASGDLDGDGVSEIVHGDDHGYVVVSRSDGSEAWHRRMPVGGDGAVNHVTVGDLDGDGRAEIVATGSRYFQSGDAGVIEVYDSHGVRRWSRDLPGGIGVTRLADLDGDGTPEIVAGDHSDGCGVRALAAADGATLWRTRIDTCLGVRLAVADIDADGRPEIGYGEMDLTDLATVALLDADGSIRWTFEQPELTAWLTMVPGGMVHGGFATQSRGHVTRHAAADGAIAWRTHLPKRQGTGSASRAGTQLPDLDGDGFAELAVTSDADEVLLISGRDGAIRWSTALEPAGTTVTQAHQSGPVTFLPAEGGEPPLLVAAEGAIGRKRSKAVVLGLDGSWLTTVALEGEAHGITRVRYADGARGVALSAGLGVYALRP